MFREPSTSCLEVNSAKPNVSSVTGHWGMGFHFCVGLLFSLLVFFLFVSRRSVRCR